MNKKSLMNLEKYFSYNKLNLKKTNLFDQNKGLINQLHLIFNKNDLNVNFTKRTLTSSNKINNNLFIYKDELFFINNHDENKILLNKDVVELCITKKVLSIDPYRRLMNQLRPFNKKIILMSMFSIIAEAGFLLAPDLVGKLVENLEQDQNLIKVKVLIPLIVLIIFISKVFELKSKFIESFIDNSAEKALKLDFIHTLFCKKDYSEPGLDRTLLEKYQELSTFLLSIYVSLPAVLISIAATFSILFMLNPQITIVLTSALLLQILTTKYLSAKIFRVNNTVFQKDSEIENYTINNLSNLTTIKHFGIQKRRVRIFNSLLSNFWRSKNHELILHSKYEIFLHAIESLSFLLILFFLYTNLRQSLISEGTFLSSLIYSQIALLSISEFVQIYFNYTFNEFNRSSLKKFFTLKNKNLVDVKRLEETQANSTFLDFENISFQYLDSDYRILDDLSFSIKNKEKLAIVGRSGSGKSTIAKLITQELHPTKGIIRLNGSDTSMLEEVSIQNKIHHCKQNPEIFSGDYLTNVHFLDLNIDSFKVSRASKLSGLDEVLKTKPEKLNSNTNSEGIGLSQGEKSVLSLARGIYKDKDFYLLDEFTSSMDDKMELMVLDKFKVFLEDKTALIISHNLETVLLADRIIIIDKGKVVDSGYHSDLLLSSKLYRALFQDQIMKKNNNTSQGTSNDC